MKTLSADELATLGLGATLLGSGGGGDPAILLGQLHYLLKKSGPITLIQPSDLDAASLVVPLALIGAPLISLERLPNSTMFMNLFKAITKQHPDRNLVLMPAEIGGCNALTPFMLAAQTSLPVLDADLIGRAFPKLNMCKPAILGKTKQATYIASPFGALLQIETDTIEALETKARDAAVGFGCSAALATFLFDGREQEEYLIAGSLTRAFHLGSLLEQHAHDLSSFAKASNASCLGTGLITEVCHQLEGGFLTGYVTLKTSKGELRVFYQNEYLLVETSEQDVLAESPSLIALIEARSGLPLTSESLRYGLKVDVFSFPAPSFWEEPQSRSQVNLSAFGLIREKGFRHV